jgi:hypothetical protein
MVDEDRPVVSVVVTIDYAAGEPETWDELRAVLKALAEQDFGEPAEVLFVEFADAASEIPADLTDILPSLRVHLSNGESDYDLIKCGVEAARAEIVATLGGDCIPDHDWMRRLVAAFRDNPDCTVVSGHTSYGPGSLFRRSMALLDRSYLHRDTPGPTYNLSNNNAAYRRSAYLKHPIVNDVGPFGTRLQEKALLRDGCRLYYEPGMRVTHHFDGWRFERQSRGHTGYATIKHHQFDPEAGSGWAARIGYLAIPILYPLRVLTSWRRCLRHRLAYGLGWPELPVTMILAILTHALEIPGMIMAIRGRPIPRTQFR